MKKPVRYAEGTSVSTPKKIYLTWNPPDSEDENGYFNQYDSLNDAVRDGQGVKEVFVAKPRSIGKFKMVTKPVRVKSRKRR